MQAMFVITGTSRGIGAALARRIVLDGHTVLGVSRAKPDPLPPGDYHHLGHDLTRT